MNIRQPKSNATTIIEVVGRLGDKKGHFELTSGNINYFRTGAKVDTLSITYQQLIAILEREIEIKSMDADKFRLPKSHKSGDFTFEVKAVDDEGEWNTFLASRSSINKLDPRRVDFGTYQFSEDMANGRAIKKYQWIAHVSIQVALWIIEQYVNKFLVNKNMSDYTDDHVVVSKKKMREFLLLLVKKIES